MKHNSLMNVLRKSGGILLVFLALLTLCGCDAAKMSSLRDVTHPYAGVYECKRLVLGGRDITELCPLTVELFGDGSYSLVYRREDGDEEQRCGEYAVDLSRREITFSDGAGRSVPFAYEEGRLLVSYSLMGTLLYAELSQP